MRGTLRYPELGEFIVLGITIGHDAMKTGRTETLPHPMKVLVHDYAGHPYAVQLSRALARRGVEVLHVYSSSNPMPQGTLGRKECDPQWFQVKPISVGETIQKAQFVKRRAQEIAHARKVGDVIREFRPDVLISGSAPLDTQNELWKVCQAVNTAPIFWLQDLTGIATELVLKHKLPVIGKPIGKYYTRMEERLLRESAAVVAISADFVPVLADAGVDPGRVHVIENWGPIDEVPVRPKVNPWSTRLGLDQTFNFIYSGTLGMKHDPSILLRLAQAFDSNEEVRVVVITEGIGRRWLEKEKAALGLDRLLLLDFQPFCDVPDVMGSADVLTAILEPSAGVFSVPSKVLAYLCAGRPLLLAVPRENLAAKTVEGIKAGLVSNPSDGDAFLANAKLLLVDPAMREQLGRNARKHAEETYDIDAIAGVFHGVFTSCLASGIAPQG